MDTISDLKGTILYYCREKLYHAMKEVSVEGQQRFPGSNLFQLLYGLSLVLSSRTNEAIRELEAVRNDQDLMLGAIVALQWAHKRCTTVDNDALEQLDVQLKAERKKSSEAGLYFAGIILLYLGKPSKASEYIDRLLKSHPKSGDGLSAKGWIELHGNNVKNAVKYFDAALDASRMNMDAAYGKIRCKEISKDYEGALNLLNQLVIRLPAFLPPLIEKMKNHLALYNWEQMIETSGRILLVDPLCLEAHKMKILCLLCQENNHEEASFGLRRLFSVMEQKEPDNWDMFMETAQLYSRICGRNPMILSETYRFAEKASHLEPSNANLISELGYQCLLQGKVKEATRLYRNATKVDDSSITALCGITLCQIQENGFNDQSKQQVEFLREFQGSEPTSNLLLLSAQLESGNTEKALACLNEAVNLRLKSVDTLPYGPKYLRNLDPDFLTSVVREYLSYAPMQPSSNGPLPTALKQSLAVLEVVTKACPCLLDALVLLARVQFLSGDFKLASKTLDSILEEVDATSAEAHLLMARINLQQQNYKLAAQDLERGVSFNFQIRESAIYHMISAMVQKQEGNIAESIVTLREAMDQLGLKAGSGDNGSGESMEVSLSDKINLFLELSDAHRQVGQTEEAARVIQEAVALFGNTSEEGRLMMANADLALEQGDVEKALAYLESILPGQPYFNRVRCKVADIYLNHSRDKDAFIKCYQEIIEYDPDSMSFAMLGDAYISILEPDLAVDAYEEAVKRSPHDQVLACKMGKILIKCHFFDKAIDFYKEATNESECCRQLKYDAAEFYLALQQFENAEKVILQELESMRDNNEMAIMVFRSQFLILLSRVKEEAGHLQSAMGTLREARENQTKILRRFEVNQNNYEDQRSVAVKICQHMAELSSSLRDNESAIRYYKEALAHNPQETDILIALAKLYMHTNDLEHCQRSCLSLLSSDPNNEAAVIMLADLAFRKVDYDAARVHFQQLLVKRPNYWTALARLVEVMRRQGKLEGVASHLKDGEATCHRPASEAGLSYCKGLYEWYSGNKNAALKLFNGARRDSEWGQQAIYNMIKICLSSDDDMLGMVDSTDDEDGPETREMALQTAQQLLGELRPRGGGTGEEVLSHRLLGNFLLMTTKQKSNVERAMQDFTALAGQDLYKDHVGVSYGISCAYVALKQTPRARNQLKRVAKNTWNFEDADYLESCWILLADIYVQNGKYDLASELLKRVLFYNKGCMKAYELSGLVAEKTQDYREATSQYGRAWKYGGQTNAGIGFKLAFNHMKNKRYADAIDVCQQILKVYPEYPRIRKDILDKCRNNLKT